MTLKPHLSVLFCGKESEHDPHQWGFGSYCMGVPWGVRNYYVQEDSNLDKAIRISEEIDALQNVMKKLKSAFVHRELEGGVKAAFTHPLYLEAEQRIAELEEQLTLLI